MEPKISVITVCYNSAATIERTIKSVLSQDYDNIEYIIIDGNSKDGTQDIIRRYEDKIAYWVSAPDKGIYDAMNKGIHRATGDLIGFLNSDDWYAEGAIKAVAEKYQETGADVIHGIVTLVAKGEYVGEFGRNPDMNGFFYKMVIPHPATFVKVNYIKAQLFDTNFKIAADYNFLLGLYCHKKHFEYLNRVVAFFSEDGVSSEEKRQHLVAKETKLAAMRNVFHLKSNHTYLKQIQMQYWQALQDVLIYRMIKNKCDISRLNHFVKQCLVFGTGKYGKQCYRLLEYCGVNVEGFLDNDKKKLGNLYEKIVELPESLGCFSSTTVIISVLGHEEEIERQLQGLSGVKKLCILKYATIKESIVRDYLKKYGSGKDAPDFYKWGY